MTEALRIIHSEHGRIWRVASLLERTRKQMLEENRLPNPELVRAICDYIENFADALHHPKENDYLFKAVKAATDEADEMIAELMAQHEGEEQILENVKGALATCEADFESGKQGLSDAIQQFISYQHHHMKMEETTIMPLAERVLTDEEWEPINAAFLDHSDPLFGDEVTDRFRDLQSQIVSLAPAPEGLGASEFGSGEITSKAEEAPVQISDEILLEIKGLSTHYGKIQALHEIDVHVRKGETVAFVGANGAGKTTLLRTISGLQQATGGSIAYAGQDITEMPAEQRVKLGIAQAPEGRQVFGPMSVEDNLLLGGYTRSKEEVAETMEEMYDLFPILREKCKLAAGTLSGGQQQMLAIARALMSRPQMLLLDEPSMGLAPLLVDEVFNTVTRLRKQGITIFLVEQNAMGALAVADRGYVIETGNILMSDTGDALIANEDVKAAYLGM